MTDQYVEALKKSLDDPVPENRLEALRILGEKKVPGVRDKVVKMINDDEAALVRKFAMQVADQLEDQLEAVPPLPESPQTASEKKIFMG